VLYAGSCLIGCLPELTNDNNQPNTSYASSHHDCFNVMTNIDLIAFILTRRHDSVQKSGYSLGFIGQLLWEHTE